jgi:sulfate permease, SulP family
VPLVTRAVPAPLVAIVALTGSSGSPGSTCARWRHGRAARHAAGVPDPDIPLTLETLLIILPYSLAVAAVGLLESLMTANIVDELTDTASTATANASARAWPTPRPASSAAWPAAR